MESTRDSRNARRDNLLLSFSNVPANAEKPVAKIAKCRVEHLKRNGAPSGVLTSVDDVALRFQLLYQIIYCIRIHLRIIVVGLMSAPAGPSNAYGPLWDRHIK